MRKNYVTFFSPGTLFSEQSSVPIESWSIPTAVEMANGILERHGAKAYGFEFKTMLEAEPVDDGEGGLLKVEPKLIVKSGLYWLGGTLLRYDQIPDTSENNILLNNMRCNNYPYIVENNNSWRYRMYFSEDACIVDADGSIRVRGNDPELMEYRKQFAEAHDHAATAP